MSTFLGLIEELPAISVDSFSGKNLDSSVFFLSHCHVDHMNGLNNSFFEYLEKCNKYLYCSPISKLILQNTFSLNENCKIKEIYIDTPVVIEYDDKQGNNHIVVVISISAGHCPGSLMFLFQKQDKLVLYTGDFRINPNDFSKLRSLHVKQGYRLLPKKLDKIYLDTTFLNPEFSYLPSRKESIMKIHEAIKEWLDQDPRNVVMLECSACYGSEFLFMELSKSLNMKIHVRDHVYDTYCCITELAPHITNDFNSTPIHACTKKSDRSLKCRYDVSKENILIIVPSVLKWQGKDISKIAEWDEHRERTYNVCYSLHSSLNELKAFVKYFDPVEIFPCVCPKDQEKQIYDILNEIMNKSTDQILKTNKPLYQLRNYYTLASNITAVNMATATALTHEKVWFEKPSYDKAERLYFERMAKVMSNKVIRSYTINTDNSVINKHEDLININASTKSKSGKSEKCKDNKSLLSDNNVSTDILKQYKCQVKNSKNLKKEDECNILKMDNLDITEKCNVIHIQKEDINICNDTVTKCTSKEVKEKKNKADTRHRNRGKGKNDIKEQKEQLPNQGNQQSTCPILPAGGSLANEVAKARQHIKQSLQCMDDIAALAGVSHSNQDVGSRIATLEKDNQDLRNVVQELRYIIEKLEKRVKVLEEEKPYPVLQICPAKPDTGLEKASDKEDDEDIDLFGSDSEGEDAEAARIREERLAAYAAKKAKKPALIAKSNIILDVKPWDDETDMNIMEAEVRKIETDGLLWGAAKLVPLAFGIHKLQISCVVEDDKVSVDWLTEQIQEIEDYVQSVDIAAFNKI
ncbi:hypothetical protein HZH68_005441 [Vespula germanica]|uniref:Protein artemis n=1 Tax=Vespula germanica TaxID=30212 RepID=A0A834KG94_VESGE|nr:hypothetical protein HZH68_005441 [Vespula germanica]